MFSNVYVIESKVIIKSTYAVFHFHQLFVIEILNLKKLYVNIYKIYTNFKFLLLISINVLNNFLKIVFIKRYCQEKKIAKKLNVKGKCAFYIFFKGSNHLKKL